MPVDHESELKLALAQGWLSPEEVEVFGEEARRLRRRPLDLLVERRRVSAEALDSLRRRFSKGAAPKDSPDEPTLAYSLDHSPAAGADTVSNAAADVTAAIGIDADATLVAPLEDRLQFPGVIPFPVRNWDRYAPVRHLGQGGMGTVFLARDLKLHRQVALKFVRAGNARHTAQLLIEARAQARVSHDRVCKVFEVGEVQGQVYIAMQYIDGQPLGTAATDLSFEQRAMAIRDAAEGVHEAHRAGIIHRDIKPGNIMVERGENGQVRTYVMDFGLARDREEDLAETGSVMGTPHFMAPEQARGEVSRLDRRADVYGLGAALYQILSGKPPIPGANNLEVLSNIAEIEPRPLREWDPDVPSDLAAITHKCLEKERSARYDSARALVEDIDRFLNGEPVRASHAGIWYRWSKRIRKHQRLVSVAGVGLVLLGLALGWGLRTRLQAAERERLARQFSERVEQVEAMARYSALAPKHDIRPDHARILARMRAIETEIGAAGPLAAGPGAYAIGRGYLALGDDLKARESLEIAWRRGFQEPRAAYALALVFGHLYQRELIEAERIKDLPLRAERKRVIEAEFRDPALTYLRQSDGADVPSREYVAALMSNYEGRYEEAIRQLDAIGETLPWFYEARQLRGDVLLAMANAAAQNGDRGLALTKLEAGRQAYAVAGAIAESVPGVWQAAGELEFRAAVIELYGGGEVGPPYERGIAATERALTIDPEHRDSLLLKARWHRSLAEYRNNRGEKVDDVLQLAMDAARRALAVAPTDPRARLEVSHAHRQIGEVLASRGTDPAGELGQALALAEGIGPADRRDEFYVNLGLIHKTWADYQDGAGENSLTNRSRAIDAYAKAIEVNPRAVNVLINLAANYQERADQPLAPDPDADLRLAGQALDQALALQPDHVVAQFYQGNVQQLIGLRRRFQGEDGREEFLRAQAAYEKGLASHPNVHFLHNGVGLALLEQSREFLERGESPESVLASAQAAFEKAIAAAPEQAWGYNGVGESLYYQALDQQHRGVDPASKLRAALGSFKAAVERLPDQPNCWISLARLHLLEAENALEQNQATEPAEAAATAALTKALAANPRSREANLLQAATRGLHARARAARGQASSEEFEIAHQAYRQALSLGEENQDAHLFLGAFCHQYAHWRAARELPIDPVVTEGLASLNTILARRPKWPEARAVHGGLLLIQARTATPPDAARSVAAQALAELTAALRDNPTLARHWKSEETAARQLAATP